MRGRNKMRTRVGLRPTAGGPYAVRRWLGEYNDTINGAVMGKMALKWTKVSVDGILMPDWARFRPPNVPWGALKTFLIPLGGLIWPN